MFEECVLDLPSITRSVIRVCEDKLDRSFSCFDNESVELSLLRNAVSLQRNRRKKRKGTHHTNSMLYTSIYEDNYGYEREEDDEDGDTVVVVPARHGNEEYEVDHMDRYDLIASLSIDERVGLFKCKVAMQWLEMRLKQSQSINAKVTPQLSPFLVIIHFVPSPKWIEQLFL